MAGTSDDHIFCSQVVVVYYKRARRSRFRPPPALSFAWKIGTKASNRIRGVEMVDVDPESSKGVKVCPPHDITNMLELCAYIAI